MNLYSFLKEVKPLVLYDVEHGIAMEPKKGKCASSRFDLGYTDLFCIPEVTSVFFSSCDRCHVDSLVFHQEHRGSLRVWLGKRNCSALNAGNSGLISRRGGCLMGFLELRQQPGVYSLVMAGVAIKNFCMFSDLRTPVLLQWTPQEYKLRLAGQYGRFWGWVRRPRFNF